jgi:hypothetical protein
MIKRLSKTKRFAYESSRSVVRSLRCNDNGERSDDAAKRISEVKVNKKKAYNHTGGYLEF